MEIDYHSHFYGTISLSTLSLSFLDSVDNLLFYSMQSISLGRRFNFLCICQVSHGILIEFFINMNQY